MSDKFKKYCYYLILAVILIFGFCLRLKWLIANPSFWDDECSLAWNAIHKSYLEFFSGLEFTQVAPPMFMATAKLFTQIFGMSDFSLRLAPFLYGTLSIIMFFIVSKEIFKNKLTIILSNFIFAINQTLINYASEFKQYSCDVFFTLFCLYLFIKITQNTPSIKKYIMYTILFSISIWFSFVSGFVICSGLFVLLIKQLKQKSFDLKKYSILALPIALSTLLYAKIYVTTSYSHNINELMNYWSNTFIAKDFSNFGILFKDILAYFFFPNVLLLPLLILLITGIIILFRKKAYLALMLTFVFALEITLSWLGVYPFGKRVVLFLLPLLLIVISANLEIINVKRKVLSLIVMFLFLAIYFLPFIYTLEYIKSPSLTRGYHPREMMEVMVNKIKPTDVIVLNLFSKTDFAYYSTYYNIKNQVIQEKPKVNRLGFLNSLPRKQYYWFYLPFGASSTFDKWFAESRNQILLEMDDKVHDCKLIYLYAK